LRGAVPAWLGSLLGFWRLGCSLLVGSQQWRLTLIQKLSNFFSRGG
jgi:hypothetical protein